MAVRHGLDRDLHRGAEAGSVAVHRGHVVGQPVRWRKRGLHTAAEVIKRDLLYRQKNIDATGYARFVYGLLGVE
jgi:hypothetical protein